MESAGHESRRERCVHVDQVVRDHPGQDGGNHYVESGTDKERTQDSARQVTLRIDHFFSGGRYRVETDISEEDQRRTTHDSAPSEGSDRAPIFRTDVKGPDHYYDRDHRKFDRNDYRVQTRALRDADVKD